MSNVSRTECEPPLCAIVMCRIDLFLVQSTRRGGGRNSQSIVSLEKRSFKNYQNLLTHNLGFQQMQ